VSKKLLLADDSVTIQKVIELTFADEDIEVIAVSNGSQAISVAPVERPDIVLADVGMPERDGYEVAAFIKRTPGLSHIPVLLLTGAFEPIDEGRAKAAGCDGVLVKPFEPQMVINRVKDLIAGKRPLAAAFQAPGAAPEPPKAPAAPMPASEYFNRLNAALGTKEPEKPSARPTTADLADELANWHPESPATTEKPADRSLIRPEAPASTVLKGTVDKPSSSVPAPSPSAAAPSPSAPPTSPAAPAPSPSAAALSSSAAQPSTSVRAPSASPSAPATSALAPSTSVPPTLAEAFAALLAAEQGKVAPAPSINEQALGEDVIEQVTRRVVERMADTAVRQVVLDVAERLVREEIDRIKGSGR
jgi:CheY-like chemotaxis protein